MSFANSVTSFLSGRKLWLCLAGLIMAGLFVFCIFFLAHDHAYLVAWFRELHPCFYRNAFWERDFFTPEIKASGNSWCWAGIVAIGIFSAFLFTEKSIVTSNHNRQPLVRVQLIDLIYLSLLIVAGCYLWHWAHHHILPYNDEVFSAVHCAKIHPFQTVAYYMLPNNHILFNLVNNIGSRLISDPLLSARVISGVCFLLILILLYFWCRQLFQYRFIGVITVLVIAVHFQTWGFAAMGRGYEMYLLCEWSAFIFLWQYLKNQNRAWLKLFTVAIILGFFTIPTFLLFYLPLLLVMIIVQCYRRRLDAAFLKYTLYAVLGVFLCHLPALCFSGIRSFLANEYVQAADVVSYADYYHILLKKMHETLWYCFTGDVRIEQDLYLVLASLPLLSLLWFRKKERLFLGVFFGLLWLCLCLVSLKMRQYSPARNLLGHLSITYGFVIVTAGWIIQFLLTKIRQNKFFPFLFPAFTGLFFYHFIKLGNDHLAQTLYQFDINTYAVMLDMDLRDLPPKADVGFSDESFYLYYISNKKGFKTTLCSGAQEEYYIKIDGETLPKPIKGNYQLMWERGDFRIYQRK